MPTTSQPYRSTTRIIVVPMLHATSRTLDDGSIFAFSKSQFVASMPPGRSFVFPILAKKVCPASRMIVISFI